MVGEEYPEECQPPDAQIPDSMMTMPEAVDVQDSPISDQEVVEMGQEALEAPDQDVYGGEDSLDIGLICETQRPGHVRPEDTYLTHGPLICGRISEIRSSLHLDSTDTNFYGMGHMLTNGFTYQQHACRVTGKQSAVNRKTPPLEYLDQGILDGFDPPRVSPRVSFKLAPARAAIDREITDFLAAKPHGPPGMMEVALSDSRYLKVHRARPTLAVKRK